MFKSRCSQHPLFVEEEYRWRGPRKRLRWRFVLALLVVGSIAGYIHHARAVELAGAVAIHSSMPARFCHD